MSSPHQSASIGLGISGNARRPSSPVCQSSFLTLFITVSGVVGIVISSLGGRTPNEAMGCSRFTASGFPGWRVVPLFCAPFLCPNQEECSKKELFESEVAQCKALDSQCGETTQGFEGGPPGLSDVLSVGDPLQRHVMTFIAGKAWCESRGFWGLELLFSLGEIWTSWFHT